MAMSATLQSRKPSEDFVAGILFKPFRVIFWNPANFAQKVFIQAYLASFALSSCTFAI